MRPVALSPLFAVLLSTVLACTEPPTPDSAPADPSPPADEAPATDPDAPAIETPASYTGTLPCADCPGIEWTLTLFEDGAYRLRRVYLEAEDGEDRPFVEIGRWEPDDRDDRLVLRGREDGPIRLAVKDAGTLTLLDQQGRPIESQFDYDLRRLAEVDRIADVFPMRGEFSYMADAGRFSPCGTRTSLPVAQEGDNAALERAYLDAAEEPGRPVLVIFRGRYAMRPPMEGSGLQEAVIVEAFEEARPGERCEEAAAAISLAGTRWQLTELPGEEGFAVDPELEAHLVFDAEAGRVSGSSGCNRLTGTYTLDGDALSLGPIAGTRMACPQPAMELERRFYAALEVVTGYSIDGEALTLSGPGEPVARFERLPE